jgi:dCMP deaminase
MTNEISSDVASPALSDVELLRLAYKAALVSPDPSTQTGGLLATSDRVPLLTTMASNGFARGVGASSDRLERPLKYSYIEHAERNVIYGAARQGITTEGTILVTTWTPCAECARAIIQAGVCEMIVLVTDEVAHWADSIDIGMAMLAESGVKVTSVVGPLGQCEAVLREGEIFLP